MNWKIGIIFLKFEERGNSNICNNVDKVYSDYFYRLYRDFILVQVLMNIQEVLPKEDKHFEVFHNFKLLRLTTYCLVTFDPGNGPV